MYIYCIAVWFPLIFKSILLTSVIKGGLSTSSFLREPTQHQSSFRVLCQGISINAGHRVCATCHHWAEQSWSVLVTHVRHCACVDWAGVEALSAASILIDASLDPCREITFLYTRNEAFPKNDYWVEPFAEKSWIWRELSNFLIWKMKPFLRDQSYKAQKSTDSQLSREQSVREKPYTGHPWCRWDGTAGWVQK